MFPTLNCERESTENVILAGLRVARTVGLTSQPSFIVTTPCSVVFIVVFKAQEEAHQRACYYCSVWYFCEYASVLHK